MGLARGMLGWFMAFLPKEEKEGISDYCDQIASIDGDYRESEALAIPALPPAGIAGIRLDKEP